MVQRLQWKTVIFRNILHCNALAGGSGWEDRDTVFRTNSDMLIPKILSIFLSDETYISTFIEYFRLSENYGTVPFFRL